MSSKDVFSPKSQSEIIKLKPKLPSTIESSTTIPESFHSDARVRANADQHITAKRKHGYAHRTFGDESTEIKRTISFGTCGREGGVPLLLIPPLGGCRFILCDYHDLLEDRG